MQFTYSVNSNLSAFSSHSVLKNLIHYMFSQSQCEERHTVPNGRFITIVIIFQCLFCMQLSGERTLKITSDVLVGSAAVFQSSMGHCLWFSVFVITVELKFFLLHGSYG